MQNSRIAAWTFNPFLRVLPAFVLGILTGIYLPIPFFISISAILCLSLFLFFVRKINPFFFSRFRNLGGTSVFLLIVCAGTLVERLHDPTNKSTFIRKNITSGDVLQVRLTEEPAQTQSGFRAVGEVLSSGNSTSTIRRSGKVYLYFRDVAKVPVYGDVLMVRNEADPLRGAMNPGAFDFKKYAANKGIYYAIYLREGEFVRTGASRNKFISFLNGSRRKILQKFDEFFPEKEVRGIAAALLIGYRGDLEKPLLQEYSDAGVVHVIAISGLHLGLIYVVLVWIFSKIRFLHRLTGVRCWLVLLLLWLFALLTGGSASVLRSAVMFSCILIGETYFKKSGTWNVIAASAFLLLVYDPLLLFDAGFLLSYAAVAGIVAWQRALYHSIYFKNKLLRQVWNMASVTIAAQLAAFPLCIYYFHQFPNLFLLTNIFVVPLSTIILFGEVIFLLLSAVPFLNDAFAFIIYFLITLMNDFVTWSNNIPFSSTHGIYADLLTAFLMYGTVICLSTWLLARNRDLAIPGFLFLSLLSVYFFYVDVKALSQQKIIFYHSSNGAIVDFINGQSSHYINYGSGLQAGDLHQIINPSRTLLRASADSKALLPFLREYPCGVSFMNKRIMVVSEQLALVDPESPFRVDLLLIARNARVTIAEISKILNPHLVVFDATNSASKIAQWKRECELLNLRCFSIRDSGALVLSLR